MGPIGQLEAFQKCFDIFSWKCAKQVKKSEKKNGKNLRIKYTGFDDFCQFPNLGLENTVV